MSAEFPFTIPERLPVRIDPCPILEAVLEIRFVTQESWDVLPGLLFSEIRDRYPDQLQLPLYQIPEEMRRHEPQLAHKPLLQFLSRDFLIQFGPRVIGLVTKPDAYPGWTRLREELEWLLQVLRQASFITEGDRLGVRYIDFFQGNVFPGLQIGAQVQGAPLDHAELSLTTAFRHPPLAGRLVVTNGALVRRGESHATGSVLDLDIWAGALDFELFANGLERFDQMHHLAKGVFFSLLKDDYLATLNPRYP